MPSDICASFIHKSLLLRLQRVALRKEGWARSLKHLNVLLHSPTRHSTAHIHPCGSMSLVSLVTSSVLMTRTSNNLCRGERDVSSLTRMSTIQSKGKKGKAKKHIQLTRKFQWQSCSAIHPHFVPSNSTILNAFLETFPIKMKPK